MPICVDCGCEAGGANNRKRCEACRAIKKSESGRKYYSANRTAVITRAKEWGSKNKEKRKEASHSWYAKNKNNEKFISTRKTWSLKNRERRLEKMRNRVLSISDSYVLQQLGFHEKEASHEIIEIKRLQLKLRRLCREKC